jgi:hypothetical protein
VLEVIAKIFKDGLDDDFKKFYLANKKEVSSPLF